MIKIFFIISSFLLSNDYSNTFFDSNIKIYNFSKFNKYSKNIDFIQKNEILNQKKDTILLFDNKKDAWKLNFFRIGGGVFPLGQLKNNKPIKAFSIFAMNSYWLNEFNKSNINNSISDRNRSAWWLLLWLAILVGWIILIVWACKQSDNGPNKYDRQ